jgi:acylphosphatase
MTAHVFISGFVQGVGFRRFVRHHALRLGLRGWVKNLPDNRVEAVLEGSKEKISQLINICRKGSFLSEVKNIAVEWEDQPQTEMEEFSILE